METKATIRALLLLTILVATAHACLWDTDTLDEERSDSPSAIELVTGAFARHSAAFYRWRIQDRQQKLEDGDDKPLHYDDIAVAYDKIKEPGNAIEWMHKKEAVHPGLYETYANLGTFHIHSGNFPEGIRYIEKALELNPQAHFNRERYQLYVVKYLQHRVQHGQLVDGKLLLPLSRDPFVEERNFNRKNHDNPDVEPLSVPDRGIFSFYTFIADDLADKTVENYNSKYARMSEEKTQEAIQGILGMMRFGHHDSAVLLECLSDLLVPPGGHGVGNRIAARAMLKASYSTEDEEAKNMYFDKACYAIAGQEGVKIAPLERALRRELLQADKYFDELVQLEASWIESGVDVESEFRKKYYQNSGDESQLAYFPIEFESVSTPVRRQNVFGYSIFVTIASLILGCSVAAHLLPKIMRKRQGSNGP